MNNKDKFYDEISSKFDYCPEMPVSLKKENVVSMLKSTHVEKTTKISLKKVGSIAAIFAIVLISTLTIGKLSFNDTNSTTVAGSDTTTTQSSTAYQKNETVNKLKKAKSREEIEEIILKNYNSSIYNDSASDYKYSASETQNAYADSIRGSGFSQTNKQTLGIDEGDIIKNDGRYLYVVSGKYKDYSLRIIDTETMKVLSKTSFYNDEDKELYIREIYLLGDRLVAVATDEVDYLGGCCLVYDETETSTIVLDIKDKASPQIMRETKQDGMYISSRMSGDTLYTVTRYTVYGKNEAEAKKNSLPTINGQDFNYDSIYIMDDKAVSYICLSAYDTKNNNSEISTLAVLGNCSNVYCSKNNLYVTGSEVSKNGNDFCVINAFSLNGSEIVFKAQGTVNGCVSSQYDLDEYNGTLRIATTSYFNEKEKHLCSLYILDSELKIIGKLEDIADDEIIRGVRYMGDKAYIVTFKNTDPLFVIDLKDPTEPKITGEVKLPGYSGYLHPISENIILGIGYMGDDEDADLTSIKVSLFDVSDMTNPKEISSFTQDNVICCVTDDPKAFIYNEEESYIALPVEYYFDKNFTGYGCYILSLEGNKITLKYKFDHEVNDVYDDLTFIRGAYIGDSFFTISDDLVYKYSLIDGTKQGEIKD